MMRTVQALLLLLAFGPAHAALQSRMSGQAIYDSTQNITWLADANRAGTSGFAVNGQLTTATAQAWITSLNAARYLGVSDWRLPNTAQPDPTCDGELTPGQNFGYHCTGSEMGHLYWVDGISQASPGPFSNIRGGPGGNYISGTPYAPSPGRFWTFEFTGGSQFAEPGLYYAWAVRPGDIDADGDGFAEGSDNCTQVANPTQLDADGDGYGNICDGDLNNSGTVTSTDFSLLRSVLNQPAESSPLAAAADMNGSGTVTSTDFGLLRARLNTAPGPSFRNLKYLLDVTRSGSGTGTVASSPAGISCGTTCSATFTWNTAVTLIATPDAGAAFTGWSGACTGTGTCVITMDAARSVTANFVPTQLLTVSVGGTGSGTVTSNPAGISCGADCTEAYQQATSVVLTATPAAGSTFAGWSGACTGTGGCTVSMTVARTVTANFNTLMDTNPACATNTLIGTVSGDTGSDVINTNAVGERWLRLHLTENDSNIFSPQYLSATISLASPTGADYDLYVYCVNCGGALAGSSTLGAGQLDTVTIRRNDNISTAQDFDVLIEIRYFTGASNNSWNLSVTGNTTANTETCP